MELLLQDFLDRFNKTTIVITQSGNLLKGSARSIPEINIGSIINNAVSKNYLLSGGGHLWLLDLS